VDPGVAPPQQKGQRRYHSAKEDKALSKNAAGNCWHFSRDGKFFIVFFGLSFCELDGGFDLEKVVPVVGMGKTDPNDKKMDELVFLIL